MTIEQNDSRSALNGDTDKVVVNEYIDIFV